MFKDKIKFKEFDAYRISYPLILLFYFIVLFIVLYKSVVFLKKEVDLVFKEKDLNFAVSSIDQTNYRLLEKKLGLASDPAAIGEIAIATTTAQNMATSSATSIPTSTPASAVSASSTSVEKNSATSTIKTSKEIKIEIINSTKSNGLAAELKKALEKEGFKVFKIGTQAQREIKTKFLAKEEILYDPIIDELAKSLSKSYAYEAGVLENQNQVDVKIIIGGNQ